PRLSRLNAFLRVVWQSHRIHGGDMLTKMTPSHLAVASVVAATSLLLTAQALAVSPQVMLEDDRFIRGSAEYGTYNDSFDRHAPVPYGRWEDQGDAYADEPDVGGAEAHANQVS